MSTSNSRRQTPQIWAPLVDNRTSTDVLNYNERELLLTKWDKNMFAQGVVLLAFEDLLPAGKRFKLSGLAVSLADATVDVSDLKDLAEKHIVKQH